MNKKLIAMLAASIAASSMQPIVTMGQIVNHAEEAVKNQIIGQRTTASSVAETDLYTLNTIRGYKEYQKAYQVTDIKVTNNSGSYTGYPLENMLDGKLETIWDAMQPNSSVKSHLDFQFNQIENIERIVYAGRQINTYEGFPKKFSIYSSLTDNENDWQLVAEGEGIQPTSAEMEIRIQPTKFKRLRFVFEEVKMNYPACAEMSFFRADEVLSLREQVFEDGLYTVLTEKAKEEGFLKDFREKVEKHPLKEFLSYELKLAESIYNDEKALADADILVASQRGHDEKERDEHGVTSLSYSLDSFGQYALPGEQIRVFVEADEEGPMPMLILGQGTQVQDGWGRREYTLRKGMNVIDVPNDTEMFPAILYIKNPATPSQQKYAPRVRVDGGQYFPVYRHGEMTAEAYNQQLAAYCEKVKAQPDIYPDITELVSENNTILLRACDALLGVEDMKAEGTDVSDTMKEWEILWEQYQIYSGFVKDDPNPKHQYYPAKYLSVITKSKYLAWSTYAYCGFSVSSRNMIKPFTAGGEDWMSFHEWGHSINNRAIEIVEVTNNLYAAYMRRYWGLSETWDDVNWPTLYNIVTGGRANIENLFVQLSIIHQVEAYFGDDTYAKACRIARENKNGLLDGIPSQGSSTERQKFVIALSHATGYDLTDFFGAYDYIEVTEQVKERVAGLKPLDFKLNYMHKSAFGYKGNGFTKDATPEISSIITNRQGQVELRFQIDAANAENLMGYEVYRDGRLIAYTVDLSKYVDAEAVPGQDYEYSIVAYDKKLNASKPATRKSNAAILSVDREITLKVGEAFNEASYVLAENTSGEDISQKVRIAFSDVDTSKAGEYKVIYELPDGADVIQKLCRVKVVDEYVYLSDAEEKFSEVGWGNFNKDLSPAGKPITLYRQGLTAHYKKGLGTHANSVVIYDLTSENLSGYDYFEAVLGIDQEMKNNTNSSVKYQVWIDNQKVYESGVLYSNSELEFIRIGIKDAKELKLVTTDADIQFDWGDYSVWGMAKLTRTNSQEDSNTSGDDITKPPTPENSPADKPVVKPGETEGGTTDVPVIKPGETEGETTDVPVVKPEETESGTTDVPAVKPGETEGGTTDAPVVKPGETEGETTDAPVVKPGETEGGITDVPVVKPGETEGGTTDAPVVKPGETEGGTTDAPVVKPGETEGGTTDVPVIKPGETEGGTTDVPVTKPDDNETIMPPSQVAGNRPQQSVKPITVPSEKNETEDSVQNNISAVSAYSDAKGHWAEEAINFVTEKNIFKGVKEGVFAPKAKMTRGMFVTLLGRVTQADLTKYTRSSYIDVPDTAYYAPAIEWAKENDISKGISEIYYSPNQNISREQMAVMIVNLLNAQGIELVDNNETIKFTDENLISPWAKKAVEALQKTGIIVGRENNSFKPKESVSRAEGAVIFSRLYALLQK